MRFFAGKCGEVLTNGFLFCIFAANFEIRRSHLLILLKVEGRSKRVKKCKVAMRKVLKKRDGKVRVR